MRTASVKRGADQARARRKPTRALALALRAAAQRRIGGAAAIGAQQAEQRAPGEHQGARGSRARSASADSTAPGARVAPRFVRSHLTSTYMRAFSKIGHAEGRPVRAEAV